MDTAVIYVRTQKGQAAFDTGNSELSSAQKTALIMIDGKRPVADIVRTISAIGNGYGLIAQLADLGMIEPRLIAQVSSSSVVSLPLVQQRTRDDSHREEIKRYMTRTLVDHLGPVSDKICLAIESVQSDAELEKVIVTCLDVLRDVAGNARAKSFENHLHYLMTGERATLAA